MFGAMEEIEIVPLDRFSADDQAGIEGLCATYCSLQSGRGGF